MCHTGASQAMYLSIIWQNERCQLNGKHTKKGDKLKREKYRGISLLSGIYKMLTNGLTKYLQAYAEGVFVTKNANLEKGGPLLSRCSHYDQLWKKGRI